MTKEIEEYLITQFGKYSYSEACKKFNLTVDEIQDVLKQSGKRKANFSYPNRSYSWKLEIAEYLRTHSYSSACRYFFISDSIIKKVVEEFDIPKLDRSSSLYQTRIENYGTYDNYVKEMVSNIKRTSLNKYGVDNYAKTKESKQKYVDTCMNKYGVSNPMQDCKTVEKFKQTNRAKYGVDWPQQNSDILNKRLKTCSDRYGGSGWKSQQIWEKLKTGMLNHYGYEYAMQAPELKEKSMHTCQEKYGVPWNCMTPQCRNSFSNDSVPNKVFAELLESNNIFYEREFGVDRYSFDFKCGHKLIEIDPTPTHNSTWSIYKDTPPMSKDYHARKTQVASDIGFQCIHIWDWDNVDKVVALLKKRLRVFARNCEVQQIEKDTAQEFLDTNHLQGYAKDSVRYGLYFQNTLVSVMTFGKPRYNKNYEWELVRYCSKYEVVGGAEKLFKHFVLEYLPKSIISYCDNSKFKGNVYTRLGFTLYDINIGKHWYNMKTHKHITDNLLRQRGFDQLLGNEYGYYGKGTSNEELMKQHDFVEIYDAGQATYIWKNS